MACEDHKKLANIVKGVHQKLRLETRKVGEHNAWKNHCLNENILKTYAEAMKQLATEFWEKNANDLTNDKAKSRVEWIISQCNNYYFLEGGSDALRKETQLCQKHGLEIPCSLENETFCQIPDRLKMLDVGSCYNAFNDIQSFDVLPIDIAPASSDVFYCDFLNVEISESLIITSQKHIIKLPELTFEVVVFSLLLEYFPSPKQRFICCKKAYKVLKPGGILCIITPDSKHATANAKIMKMWRYALADLGFSRLTYEKLPHLHCMVYRKCFNPHLSQHWLSLTFSLGKEQPVEELMAIPQDSISIKEDKSEENTSTRYLREEDHDIAFAFEDLPQF